MGISDYLFIFFTVILVLIFPIFQYFIKDKKWKLISLLIYIPLSICYVVLTIYIQHSSKILESKIAFIENQPDFDEKMWEFFSGVPSDVIKYYNDADDAYRKKNYVRAGDLIKLAINEYEKRKVNIDLKNYASSSHYEKISELYTFASKVFTRLKMHKLAYEYGRNGVQTNPSEYNYYALAVAAYNMKRYQESLDNINKAIELRKNDSKIDISIYMEIKQKSKNHLAVN